MCSNGLYIMVQLEEDGFESRSKCCTLDLSWIRFVCNSGGWIDGESSGVRQVHAVCRTWIRGQWHWPLPV